MVWTPGRGFTPLPPHSPLLAVVEEVARIQGIHDTMAVALPHELGALEEAASSALRALQHRVAEVTTEPDERPVARALKALSEVEAIMTRLSESPPERRRDARARRGEPPAPRRGRADPRRRPGGRRRGAAVTPGGLPGNAAAATGCASFARMTATELAAFYRRYNACCNDHRFEDLAQFVAPDVVINGTGRGLDTYAENLQYVVDGFPDFHWELRRLVVEPPWIAAFLADTGTHRAPFLGVPATGRPVSTQEFAFYRIDGDRIAEVWGTAFGENLLHQVREPAAAPRP
jgi:predicted ester cyclase